MDNPNHTAYHDIRNSNLSDALRGATALLSEVSETARLDSELLAAHALNMERMEMLSKMRDLSPPPSYAAMIERRMANEPVAYITGKQAFWDIELNVTPDTLIPRSDSEALLDAAQNHFADRINDPLHILDMGTGSGALLLAALSIFPHAQGSAIDSSEAAIKVAQNNAVSLNMHNRSDFCTLSWRDAKWTEALNAPFDIILCNPPYIEEDAKLAPMVADFEPASALYAGADGYDDYRIITPHIPDLLKDNGIALFEIGATQASGLSELAKESGLCSTLFHDLSGLPRCIKMHKS